MKLLFTEFALGDESGGETTRLDSCIYNLLVSVHLNCSDLDPNAWTLSSHSLHNQRIAPTLGFAIAFSLFSHIHMPTLTYATRFPVLIWQDGVE